MTDLQRPRPVPGPPRQPGPAEGPPAVQRHTAAAPGTGDDAPPLAELARRPTAEHVAAFEREHARLRRELGTIDPL